MRAFRKGASKLGDNKGADPAIDAIKWANASRLPRALDAITRSLSPTARTDRALRIRAQTWANELRRRAQRRRSRLDVFGFGVESQHSADLAVASQALQGDAHAVDAVRVRVQAIVLSRIYGMGMGRYEDELLESIMDRIWDKLPSYRGQASLPTWAWTVASNYLRNWQRDVGSRYARTLRIDAYAGTGNSIAAPAEDAPSYSMEETERQERGRRLMARISEVASSQLRPDEWELIQRVIVRGEEYAAIATEQSERPGTLRARVFRALSRLRGPLRQELDDEAGEYLREA
jgi:RNA polymerase sigma factor (sigma-70 family)